MEIRQTTHRIYVKIKEDSSPSLCFTLRTAANIAITQTSSSRVQNRNRRDQFA